MISNIGTCILQGIKECVYATKLNVMKALTSYCCKDPRLKDKKCMLSLETPQAISSKHISRLNNAHNLIMEVPKSRLI
jgi:hypothetical protein